MRKKYSKPPLEDSDALTIPPTEVEVSELTKACQEVLTPAGMLILWRILFERDCLLNKENDNGE